MEHDRILNLVDLDNDGKIEMLFPFTSEHGLIRETVIRTSLYVIADGYFRRVTGPFAGRTFPVAAPSGIELESEPDLTTAIEPTSSISTLSEFQERHRSPCWLNGISVKDGGILLNSDDSQSRRCEGYLQLQHSTQVPSPFILAADFPGKAD